MTTSIVIGGTGDIGRAIATAFARRGDTVVVTGRDRVRADSTAAEIGRAGDTGRTPASSETGQVRGLGLDLSQPETIEPALADITVVDHLVLTAIDPTPNSLAAFDIHQAVTAITIKIVGYAEVVRVLRDRFRPGAAVVLFGGLAKERPYPGSTMVTAFNGGVSGLVKTLAREIAPHRVNAIHSGIVGDSARWRAVPLEQQPGALQTPIGRFVTKAEIVDAVDFLLRNGGVNAFDLYIDGGFLIT